jgi:uncharacterized membrane protein
MIERHGDAASGGAWQLVLRPNRSMSARQLIGFFLLQATVALLVSLYAWTQGNVFAPLFALLHAGFIAFALRLAWRGGDRCEVVAVTRDRIEVRRGDDAASLFHAHPYWVRMRLEESHGEPRLTLRASGRVVELGSFLAPIERRRLADTLHEVLSLATAGSHRDATAGTNEF